MTTSGIHISTEPSSRTTKLPLPLLRHLHHTSTHRPDHIPPSAINPNKNADHPNPSRSKSLPSNQYQLGTKSQIRSQIATRAASRVPKGSCKSPSVLSAGFLVFVKAHFERLRRRSWPHEASCLKICAGKIVLWRMRSRSWVAVLRRPGELVFGA